MNGPLPEAEESCPYCQYREAYAHQYGVWVVADKLGEPPF